MCDRRRYAQRKTQANTQARKQMSTKWFQGWSTNSHMSAHSKNSRWSSDLRFLTTLMMSKGFAQILTEPYTTSQAREKLKQFTHKLRKSLTSQSPDSCVAFLDLVHLYEWPDCLAWPTGQLLSDVLRFSPGESKYKSVSWQGANEDAVFFCTWNGSY